MPDLTKGGETGTSWNWTSIITSAFESAGKIWGRAVNTNSSSSSTNQSFLEKLGIGNIKTDVNVTFPAWIKIVGVVMIFLLMFPYIQILFRRRKR